MGKTLRTACKKSRAAMGRKPEPGYGLIDSRSVKTAMAAQNKGYDGGKKVKGRKQHIVTDTQGHLLHVRVHAANIHDTVGGGEVIREAKAKYPSLKGASGDAGYRKTFEEVAASLGLTVYIVERIQGAGWMILPKRWVVERTFGWFGGSRRLSKDYEILTATVESLIYISHAATLLKRVMSDNSRTPY
jgi:putative transposase